jgi:hypothetical protein
LTRRFIDIAADILLTGRENPPVFFCRGVKKAIRLGQKFPLRHAPK